MMKSTEIIKGAFADCGITEVGFCRFYILSENLIDCRAVKRIPENAKTVIAALFPYKISEKTPLNISRYAALPDYHTVCGNILSKVAKQLKLQFPENVFEPFIDNSPLPEVYTAAAAGLGIIGENRMLINPKFGSYCFIGELISDIDVGARLLPVIHCEGCGLCRTVCPSCLDKSQCLSAITQKKGILTPDEEKMIKAHGSVWGCDICQECCPHNKGKALSRIKEFSDGYRDRYTPGEDIHGRAYEWRGKKTVRRNSDLINS